MLRRFFHNLYESLCHTKCDYPCFNKRQEPKTDIEILIYTSSY